MRLQLTRIDRESSKLTPLRKAKAVGLAAALFIALALTPGVWTQVPPVGALVGPTPSASVKNAADATRDQAAQVRNTANTWAGRARSASYQSQNLASDLSNMQFQYGLLRDKFNWLASMAQQAGRPQAQNALAELDAGLNIIAELFHFLDEQIRSGTLDRDTLVRTCRTFEDVMREWELELRKSRSRIGAI